MHPKAPYEEGFLIILIVLAIVGLFWLFSPFMEALLFAVILATATYSLYTYILKKVKGRANTASAITCFLVVTVVILPISYLLVESGLQMGHLYTIAEEWLGRQTPESISHINKSILHWFNLEPGVQAKLLSQIKEHTVKILGFAQQSIVYLVQGIVGSSTSFITFISLATFALFFFYRDGAKISYYLKVLSPLENYYDSLIMNRFASLSTVLLLSILGIAVMQGISFALVAEILGLPALFIGMSIAITSFIPLVGAALVWIPIALFLGLNGQIVSAVVVVVWGAVVNGFIIDSVMRPVLINKISRLFPRDSASNMDDIANHTLIVVLSTFAGLIHFGMIGLFFGPVIAAMAITIFEVYERKNTDLLDRS